VGCHSIENNLPDKLELNWPILSFISMCCN
jgi:hypothetical protein